MEMRTRSLPIRPRTRPGQSAQGLVEFALAGSFFFFLVFSIANAGFFLYGRSAMEHAADVGAAALAAEGQCTASGGICAVPPAGCPGSDADQVAICRMSAAALTTTPFITVTSVDLYRVAQNNGATVSTCSGTPGSLPGSGSLPCDAYTCNAGGTTDTGGSLLCEDQYTATGTAVGTVYWPPPVRNVTSPSADFAELAVTFTYHLIAYPGSFTLTTTNVFRLEPQLG